MEGVLVKTSDNCRIVTITMLSEELKEVIRTRFSAICRGEQISLLNRGSSTYERTVAEFLKRVESKEERLQTGMIGELIVHVLTSLVFPEYKTLVPYFNLEERSIAKGFDSVIYSPDIGIWVYEVKSSRQDNSVNLDSKSKGLIKTAHDDLSGKLSQRDETTRIWDNAMNGFQVACGHLGDEKRILESIILDYQDNAHNADFKSNDNNVILSSVLISPSAGEIKMASITEKHNEYQDSYKNLMIFAVHKSLTVDLLEFFKQEINHEVS